MLNRENFYEEVYELVRQIPCGQVCTYGYLARLIGWPQHARMVGRALAEAKDSLQLPCHRVLNCQGRTVPHWAEQRKLLEEEGVIFKKNGCVDLGKYLWKAVVW